MILLIHSSSIYYVRRGNLNGAKAAVLAIEFKGGKHDEIGSFGNMFFRYLGDSEFVPWPYVYLGGYSFWGDSCYSGVNRGIKNQRIALPASNHRPNKVWHKLTGTTRGCCLGLIEIIVKM